MSEAESSPEIQPRIEKVTHGECVVYATTIKPNSVWDATQNEAQQTQALQTITMKTKAEKESIVGTALISTTEQSDWPASKLQSTLIVIGAAPKSYARPGLSVDAKQTYTTTKTGDVSAGSVLMAPDWKDLFKGILSKEMIEPIAYFGDQAMQSLGKNINISVHIPQLGGLTAYMMATKRSENPAGKQSAWMPPNKPIL